jgi:hypothetical protein
MDYYEVLGVDPSATAEEIRLAYVRLAKRVHPDSGGNAALFRQIEEAYRVLSNPAERERHNRERGRQTSSRPRTGPTIPTPQAVVEEVLHEGTKWVKGVAEKHAAKRDQKLRELQAIWPKEIGHDFLRVDLKSWLPFLTSAVPGQTQCTASWARHETVEAPMTLVALGVDEHSPPRRLIWRVQGTERDWISWQMASPDGSEVELRMKLDASPGCRPRWARRKLAPGTYLIVDNWVT